MYLFGSLQLSDRVKHSLFESTFTNILRNLQAILYPVGYQIRQVIIPMLLCSIIWLNVGLIGKLFFPNERYSAKS